MAKSLALIPLVDFSLGHFLFTVVVEICHRRYSSLLHLDIFILEEVTVQEKEIEEEGNKKQGEILEQEIAKKQRMDEDAKELKRHLQIVANNDDDVYTEATPLASKVPVVDYQIHHENNKPYYKIIRAYGTYKLFLSFITLLKNFDREDLETLWKLVKERFETTKPKNFSCDFLLNILKIVFEKPNVKANVWKDHKGIYGLAKNGNGHVSVTTDTNGMIKVLPPKTAEEVVARERERKTRTTLLMALPKDHLAKFHKMVDAKKMWEAIKSRFGGNDDSKLETMVEDLHFRMIQKLWLPLMERILTGLDILKKLYDEQREKLGDASIEITAYTLALKKVEAQLLCHQQNQLAYEQKIRFMKIDLDDKINVLTYHKKLLAEALKEKEDLKAKVENWQNSSKNLNKLLNTQMSANDKFGLGYGDYRYGRILSYENEVLQSVFMNKECDLENTPVNDRYAEGMHTVPPPMIWNYMPSGPHVEIDYSKLTYGPKQTSADELDSKHVEYASSDYNSRVEPSTYVPKPVVNESKVVSEPKVVCEHKMWTDAPIIDEYESDSDDDLVFNVQENIEKSSFAFTNYVKHVKTPRENVKEKGTPHHYSKIQKQDRHSHTRKGLGYVRKSCFVCGSLVIS
nr:xylulose kinase-1 [Tanacetum cinerariifolium]